MDKFDGKPDDDRFSGFRGDSEGRDHVIQVPVLIYDLLSTTIATLALRFGA
jgi:hypothetical protein